MVNNFETAKVKQIFPSRKFFPFLFFRNLKKECPLCKNKRFLDSPNVSQIQKIYICKTIGNIFPEKHIFGSVFFKKCI